MTVGHDGARIQGLPPGEESELARLNLAFRNRLFSRRIREKQAREDERNKAQDPLHVDVPSIKDRYRAWSVVCDESVDGDGMTRKRYHVPPEMDTNDPFHDYRWFGAEVVGPVLSIGDERARQAIRDACGALRDKLRIHKPMEVSSGLHVHLGHTQGWVLPQLKRFAVVWYLTENTLFQFHRKDRDRSHKVSRATRWFTPSFRRRAGFGFMPGYSKPMPFNPSHILNLFAMEAQANIPYHRLTREQKAMTYWIWQFNSINGLNAGLGKQEHKEIRTGLKWRVRGLYSSYEKSEDGGDPQPGTVEVRIMQGTLDADYINNWVSILERIVHVVRKLKNHEFKALLDTWLQQPTAEKLLEVLQVPEDLRKYWTDPKRRDKRNEWWEYPDRDMVDWGQPFMVPGHRATHGPEWDD
ncbi:hypothetical protein F5Y17DRAFT_454122 [Xylariaceae sp. FL0594]|nr:hypothetical protein F5Y17DRAFT_454122 [Xylariaceae sp. FL0594]